MNLDDLIARLTALSSADREWLLAALSAQARERLLHLTRAELSSEAAPANATEPAAEAAPQPEPCSMLIAELARTPVGVLAEVLGDEPIWLTAAVLRAADWPWRAQLLQRLPHVAVCLCPALDTAQPMSEHFTRALLERVAAKAASVPAASGKRFDGLLQKLATRRRKASWQ